jgi:hypothetical protein
MNRRRRRHESTAYHEAGPRRSRHIMTDKRLIACEDTIVGENRVRQALVLYRHGIGVYGLLSRHSLKPRQYSAIFILSHCIANPPFLSPSVQVKPT